MKHSKWMQMLLMLLSVWLLVGCVKGDTSVETDAPFAEPNIQGEEGLTLISDGKSQLRLIQFDGEDCEAVLLNFEAFRDHIKAAYGLSKISAATDFEEPQEGIVDIVIGDTIRTSSKTLKSKLPERSWGISIDSGEIAIAATDDAYLGYALNWFLDRYVTPGSDQLTVPSKLLHTETAEDEPTLSEALTDTDFSYRFSTKDAYEVRPIFNSEEGWSYNCGQGACTDGAYLYAALLKILGNNSYRAKLVKLRASDRSVVAVSEDFAADVLGHCNDMCYDPVTGEIILVNMVGGKYTVIEPETLAVKRTGNFPCGNAYCITYDRESDGFYVISNRTLYHYNRAWSEISSKAYSIGAQYTAQGLFCDDDYLYTPLNRTENGKLINDIAVYDKESLTYLGTVSTDGSDEIETMLCLNGALYGVYNTKNPEGNGTLIQQLTLYPVLR